MNKRMLGTTYEKLAGAFLEQLGYEIMEYNFRCRLGEIDIIARDGEYLVFAEVKYRKTAEYGSPALAVNRKKQQTISRVAAFYCYTNGIGETAPCRFDVISVCGKEIKVIKNAFEYQGYK